MTARVRFLCGLLLAIPTAAAAQGLGGLAGSWELVRGASSSRPDTVRLEIVVSPAVLTITRVVRTNPRIVPAGYEWILPLDGSAPPPGQIARHAVIDGRLIVALPRWNGATTHAYTLLGDTLRVDSVATFTDVSQGMQAFYRMMIYRRL